MRLKNFVQPLLFLLLFLAAPVFAEVQNHQVDKGSELNYIYAGYGILNASLGYITIDEELNGFSVEAGIDFFIVGPSEQRHLTIGILRGFGDNLYARFATGWYREHSEYPEDSSEGPGVEIGLGLFSSLKDEEAISVDLLTIGCFQKIGSNRPEGGLRFSTPQVRIVLKL